VKRFLKTLGLLSISLFLIVSGVDAALDHLSHADTQNSFTVYNEQGNVVLAYDGDLSACKVCARPEPIAVPGIFHRT
jgi:hypothetical protein